MSISLAANATLHWRDYLGVCKLKVVALIVFTALVGMFLSVPGMVPWQPLIFGTLGIGMAAAVWYLRWCLAQWRCGYWFNL